MAVGSTLCGLVTSHGDKKIICVNIGLACCQTVSSYYLNQCWRLIGKVLWKCTWKHFTASYQGTVLYITNLKIVLSKLRSKFLYKPHPSSQYNCWSLRCSWSIACRRCSNYIFIPDLTPGFNGLGKDNCKTRRGTFKYWSLGIWCATNIRGSTILIHLAGGSWCSWETMRGTSVRSLWPPN